MTPAMRTPTATTQTPIRLVVVDDHELVRRGIVSLLESQADMEVVAEASTATQAQGRVGATRPDVVLLDMRLPDGNGIDVCRDLRSQLPDTRCIIVTAYDDDDAINAAVLAGASAYILKGVPGSNLLETVRKAAAGLPVIDSLLRRAVVGRIREGHTESRPFAMLTPRENQVLDLIAEGMTNRQIAHSLQLAEKTVKNYVSRLLAKLDVQRRTQAARLRLQGESGK